MKKIKLIVEKGPSVSFRAKGKARTKIGSEDKSSLSYWLKTVQERYLKKINLDVLDIQKNLTSSGHLKSHIPGKLDNKTFDAIARFQEQNKDRIIELGDPSPVDKIYGPITHRVWLETTGQYKEAEKITQSDELEFSTFDDKYNPEELNSYTSEQILIVGDSTAVGLMNRLGNKYTGGFSKKTFTFPDGKKTNSLPTHNVMDTAIGGARTGLILHQLEKRIETLQQELGHNKVEKKLMIIHCGGNDSRWFQLQKQGQISWDKDASPKSNLALHDPEFTYNNIIKMAQIGEEYGYEVRIVSLRFRGEEKFKSLYRDKSGLQNYHQSSFNLKIRTSKYYVVPGILPSSLVSSSDLVHASPAGSSKILSRAMNPKAPVTKTIKLKNTKLNKKIPDLKNDIEFLQKVKNYAKKHGADPNDFLAVMYHETGTLNLDPAAENNNKNPCVGLIQFCPGSGMKVIGKSGAELKRMTRSEQWDYVEVYMNTKKAWKSNPTLSSIYLAIFLPALSGLNEDAILAAEDPSVCHPVARRLGDNFLKRVWKQNPANRSMTTIDKKQVSVITKEGMAKNIKSKSSRLPKNLFGNLPKI